MRLAARPCRALLLARRERQTCITPVSKTGRNAALSRASRNPMLKTPTSTHRNALIVTVNQPNQVAAATATTAAMAATTTTLAPPRSRTATATTTAPPPRSQTHHGGTLLHQTTHPQPAALNAAAAADELERRWAAVAARLDGASLSALARSTFVRHHICEVFADAEALCRRSGGGYGSVRMGAAAAPPSLATTAAASPAVAARARAVMDAAAAAHVALDDAAEAGARWAGDAPVLGFSLAAPAAVGAADAAAAAPGTAAMPVRTVTQRRHVLTSSALPDHWESYVAALEGRPAPVRRAAGVAAPAPAPAPAPPATVAAAALEPLSSLAPGAALPQLPPLAPVLTAGALAGLAALSSAGVM